MTGGPGEARILTIGAIALGCNVACLLVLLARPTGRFSAALVGRLARGCRVALAEAVGTFGLVFVGAVAAGGPALAGAEAPAAPLLGVALAQGLLVAGLVAALAPAGGGHFNPAVTLGLALAGRLAPLAALGRIAAQLSGALAGGCLLAWMFGSGLALTVPRPAPQLTDKAVFLLEAVGTFFFVLVVAGTTADERARPLAPFAIGLTLTGVVLALGPLTGAAINPARYLGLAVPAGNPGHALIYTAGPACGGGLAAVFVQLFLVPVPLGRADCGAISQRSAVSDQPSAKKAA